MGIKDNVSYISKDFADWVLSWSLQNNVYNPPGGVDSATFQPGTTYTCTSGLTLPQLINELNIPDVVVQGIEKVNNVNYDLNWSCIFDEPYNNDYDGYEQSFRFYGIAKDQTFVFRNYDDLSYDGVEIYETTKSSNIYYFNINLWSSDMKNWKVNGKSSEMYLGGYRAYSLSNGNVVNKGLLSKKSPKTYIYNMWNAVKVPGADYGLTDDVPVAGQSIDNYAPSWAAREDTVAIDNIQTNAIPLSIPIDGASAAITDTVSAADVIAGTAGAIAAAGAMAQTVARSGEIAAEATDTFADAVETAETEETLNGEYTIQGLEDVFPFCLPWDFAEFVGLLNASPEAPKFSLPTLDQNGNLVYYEFDFAPFSPVAAVGRTGETILFILGLIVLTKRLFV